jgi:hypothetical protein
MLVDISDPTSPQKVATYETNTYNIAISGNYLYLGKYGVEIVDISNPLSPQYVSYYDTGETAEAVSAMGNYIYLASRNYGLIVLKQESYKKVEFSVD